MDFEQLSLFIEVARRGSFAAVARDRGTTPSSVSRVVATLEASLGARLFQRTTRAMALTEAGELYLARLPAILEQLESVREDAVSLHADPVGVLRVTASVAFGEVCLVPLLPEFAERFPRLTLELVLSDENLDLARERIDLAIRLGPKYDTDVVGVKLFGTRYRVVASPTYLERRGRPGRPADLAAHECLLFALPSYRSRWIFRKAAETVEVPVHGRFVVSSALPKRRAAIAGLGPALLPDWLIGPDVAAGRLEDLFPGYDVTATTFGTSAWLLYPRTDALPRKTRIAVDFLRSRLKRPGGRRS